MKTTVSEKGQITIPKTIRESLGLGPGTILDVQEADGGLVLRKRNTTDPIEQWRGKARLPIGKNVDEYLASIR